MFLGVMVSTPHWPGLWVCCIVESRGCWHAHPQKLAKHTQVLLWLQFDSGCRFDLDCSLEYDGRMEKGWADLS